MTSPAARNSEGIYEHPVTGEKFPSYSSVASMLSKPALMYWAANRVSHAQVYNTPWVWRRQAQLLFEAWEKGGDLDPQDAYYHALRGFPWAERDESADLGTAVHAAIEAYQTNRVEWPEYPEDVAPFMKQFEGFLRDHKPRIIANEMTVYNRTIGYAGTLDILAGLPIEQLDAGAKSEELAIVDVKTGKNVYEDAAIQQNAYANGECFYDPWDRKDIDMPKVEAAYILHVRPDFYRLIPVTLSQENFDMFCALRQAWEWDHNHKKSALGKGVKVKVK